ncbi:MAG: hypothetical protein ABIT01_19690 [Thermoanaerobaculia bacterium]
MSQAAPDPARFGAITVSSSRWSAACEIPLASRLAGHAAVVVREALPKGEADALASRVLAASKRWTPDFGGEQFTLGRAFYTHLETGRTKEYFQSVKESDALVESILPGIAARTLALLGRLIGAPIRRRPGFCGPGVHIFSAKGKVASEGGVVHFDLEGLTAHQLAAGDRAVTLVWTLAPAQIGGGLRLWNALYAGRPDSEIEPDDHENVTIRSGAGDALLLDSRRLHQIRPFRGNAPRVSITVHGVEVDRGVWEAWF